jgi:predicted nucleotide-binding protein (sugar kinase/HSP70/actin superfamily)
VKAAFPHMGYIYVNLGALVRHLGAELCMGPRPNRATLANGVRHSPEQYCIPFKVNLGDLMASLDEGVELLISVQGAWSCRFGYYGHLHHTILRDLGYEFQSLILDGSRESMHEMLDLIKRLNGVHTDAAAARIFIHAFRIAFKKGKLLQISQTYARQLRPVEAQPGTVNRLFDRIVERIDSTEDLRSLGLLENDIREEFAAVPVREGIDPVRVMIVGEVYIALEPLVNAEAERTLGSLGALVDVYVDEHRWFIHPFRLGVRGQYRERHAHRLATPYLKYNLGGEDKNTLGFTIIAAERGFDGVVHLKPFTCMPEGVAKHILYKVSQDHGIPFVSFTVDEHSAEAGMLTRMEAFVDMLDQRRELLSTSLAGRGAPAAGQDRGSAGERGARGRDAVAGSER